VEIHGNAGLLPCQRALMCRRVREEGWTVAEAAEAAGVAERTTYRWLRRWDSGEAMTDRSSAPKRCPTKTSAEREALIEQLRRFALEPWRNSQLPIAGFGAAPNVRSTIARLALTVGGPHPTPVLARNASVNVGVSRRSLRTMSRSAGGDCSFPHEGSSLGRLAPRGAGWHLTNRGTIERRPNSAVDDAESIGNWIGRSPS